MNKLWRICEQVESTKSWASYEQVMNKKWTRHEQIMNKSWKINMSWTSSEQVLSKSLTSHEQVMTKSWPSPIQFINKFWKTCEQLLNMAWTKPELFCEQVAKKYCLNEIFERKRWSSFRKLVKLSRTSKLLFRGGNIVN